MVGARLTYGGEGDDRVESYDRLVPESGAFGVILGRHPRRPAPKRFGPFHVVELDNHVSLDYYESVSAICPQHYAFLITEEEFDAVFARLTAQNLAHWADPGRKLANRINNNDGGRGVYFDDPNGHLMEVITRPYGSG
jgi:catechol 2,3-dioxygenase-like lactoylglutathione lyase family enzyme